VRFLLGTHHPYWLGQTSVPLFISVRALRARKRLPVALGSWGLDSGAFWEVHTTGGFETSARQYAAETRRFHDEIGGLDWAAPQDWPCEDFALTRTGLTVREHQRRSVASILELRTLDPGLPFVPVLQGQTVDDYLRCVDLYDRAGIDLTRERLVGVGSVCRRQHTSEIQHIMWTLARLGISLHGFGVKAPGLALYAGALASADSLAWSYDARREPGVGGKRGQRMFPGHSHKSCANCLEYALAWRARVLAACTGHEQMTLDLSPPEQLVLPVDQDAA
jgi:hypothetical protein